MRGRELCGRPVSPGYARGSAVLVGQPQRKLPHRRIPPHEIDQELDRFRLALKTSRSELRRLSNRVQSELGAAEAEIFSAHLLFLEDPQFIERVEEAVRRDRINIEAAIDAAVSELAQLLREADNAYLREREEDVRDLGRRVLRHVAQAQGSSLGSLGPASIVVARGLLPSDLLEIDRAHPLGIVTERGGEAGHAAILARALGGDKSPGFLASEFEANPNLGMRGLRFSLLAAQDLFRTQVRAVLDLARAHEVSLLLPMCAGRGGPPRRPRADS